jgi:hypothetical protein
MPSDGVAVADGPRGAPLLVVNALIAVEVDLDRPPPRPDGGAGVLELDGGGSHSSANLVTFLARDDCREATSEDICTARPGVCEGKVSVGGR